MNDDRYENHILNEDLPTDFTVDEILAEFSSDTPDIPQSEKMIADKSKRIVLDAIDESVGEASFSSLDELLDSVVEETAVGRPSKVRGHEKPEDDSDDIMSDLDFSGEDEETGEDAEEVRIYKPRKPGDVKNSPFSGASIDEAQLDDSGSASYAAADFPVEDIPASDIDEVRRASVKEKFLSPVMALMALVAMKLEQSRRGDEQAPTESEEEVPEMQPDRAAKLYGSQSVSLKLRAMVAGCFSVVMAYMSFAFYSKLPLPGAFAESPRAMALMFIVLELSVMIAGLDAFTSGVMNTVRKKIGLESLVSISCILSILDAALIAITGKAGFGLPFCAVSAVSLTFVLIGSYFTCRGFRTSFKVLGSSQNLYTVTSERVVDKKNFALLKSRMESKGFIKHSEQADISEYVFSVLSPFLLAVSVIFALTCSVFHGAASSFFHCLSGMAAVCATFSAAVCFALPFAVTAKRLALTGAAIAGWSGVRDIGKSSHVIITDNDVFPPGTVEVATIRILEGFFSDKVISYTGSVAMASSSGLSGAFAEMIRRNAYSINKVENFEAHDGGGMTAMVGGESVYIGNAGFMNLMGIRIPRKLNTPSSVFTAISGQLVGIFEIGYKPVSSVQNALALLLRSNHEPVFAIRDFNITPVMIKQKFKMPTDKFEFPSYSERYRISSAEPTKGSRVSAVLSREGMGPLVEVSDKGKRLYTASFIGAFLSAACAVIGLVMLFLLFWAGAYDSASVSNILAYMLLWFLPCVVLTWSLGR